MGGNDLAKLLKPVWFCSKEGVMLKVVWVRVAELRPNPQNPVRIRPERFKHLQRTLSAEPELLQVRPLIALHDGTVIAGNQRLEAARALGWERVPVVFVKLDEARAVRWAFLDNRRFGEDDEDLVAELLAALEDRGSDLDLTGYSQRDTDALLRRLVRPPLDPDELPPLEAEPDSKAGMVYELGSHRVMCGDATNPDHVAALLAADEPTLIVTDPPYGVQLDNRWRERAGLNRPASAGGARSPVHQTRTVAGDTVADWSDACVLAPSCAVSYVWHASSRACEVQAGLERIGFEVRQQLIWNKELFVLSRQPYNWQHEPCFFATRSGAHVPWYGAANQSTVWTAASPKMVAASTRSAEDAPVDHATQKPVALFTRPIENHLRRGEVVYDPFAGSGTALIAAELTGRRCLAMELDPRCCDLIRARFEGFVDGR
jgi:DNA modification methylase